jgi:Scavenger receptor cysteine-rich domain
VCTDSLRHLDASMLCHWLGFPGGYPSQGDITAAALGSPLLYLLGCHGGEASVDECDRLAWGAGCTEGWQLPLAVACTTPGRYYSCNACLSSLYVAWTLQAPPGIH